MPPKMGAQGMYSVQITYVEPTNLEPHFGQLKFAHGVFLLCDIEYPQTGHLQLEGPPILCLAPPLPLPYPLLMFIAPFFAIILISYQWLCAHMRYLG
jgi:hypothetical protein